MDDEVLARLASLIGVMDAGIDEGLLDPVTVDRDRRLVGVLLDDREQIAEQPLLDRRELGALDRRLRRARLLDPIYLDPRWRDQRGLTGVRAVARVARGRLRRAAVQPFARGFALLLRNRRPSSCRFAYTL
jgi:hypothetical protein